MSTALQTRTFTRGEIMSALTTSGYTPPVVKKIVNLGETLTLGHVNVKLDYADPIGKTRGITFFTQSSDGTTRPSIMYTQNMYDYNSSFVYLYPAPRWSQAVDGSGRHSREGTPLMYMRSVIVLSNDAEVYELNAIIGPELKNNSLQIQRIDIK